MLRIVSFIYRLLYSKLYSVFNQVLTHLACPFMFKIKWFNSTKSPFSDFTKMAIKLLPASVATGHNIAFLRYYMV